MFFVKRGRFSTRYFKRQGVHTSNLDVYPRFGRMIVFEIKTGDKCISRPLTTLDLTEARELAVFLTTLTTNHNQLKGTIK